MNNPIINRYKVSNLRLFSKLPEFSPTSQVVLILRSGGCLLKKNTSKISRRELLGGIFTELVEINMVPVYIRHTGEFLCNDLIYRFFFKIDAEIRIVSPFYIARENITNINEIVNNVIIYILERITIEYAIEETALLHSKITLIEDRINDRLEVYGIEICLKGMEITPENTNVEPEREKKTFCLENSPESRDPLKVEQEYRLAFEKEKYYRWLDSKIPACSLGSSSDEDVDSDGEVDSDYIDWHNSVDLEVDINSDGTIDSIDSIDFDGADDLSGVIDIYDTVDFGSSTIDTAVSKQKPMVSNVQFSAISPDCIKKGMRGMIEIFMYENDYRSIVEKALKQRRNVRETVKGTYNVANGSQVLIVLESLDINILDNSDDNTWRGRYCNFSFIIEIPDNYEKDQVAFTGKVYIDAVLITKIKFLIDVNGDQKKAVPVDKTMIKTAFVSYASIDKTKVMARIQGMEKVADIDFFVDELRLKSGQVWEPILYEEINKRDIMFLFWSKNAASSDWVKKEWEYALKMKGIEYIEPVPIELPVYPPPNELSSMHFSDSILRFIDNGN